MKQEAKPGGLGYATDEIKGAAQTSTRTESMSLKRGDSRIVVSISKRREMSQSPQYCKYEISKYDLHPGYLFPESLDSLVPTGTPEYVDSGQKYVERIVRALSYFNHCAMIVTSGT